ncbi:hypothetical protein SU32_03130 [Ahrensia marina]|uniref:Phage tail assembly chaperone n=2 Tax=Ahrensia marina TaxID=1514904 RepID=A0A0M9GPE2_9HYPH|nr:hypothetical protein SU32_03130 [Ahrensia marina]
MTFGLGTLKLPSEAFWRSTPLEISAALRAFSNAASVPPSRKQFEEMMARFPDTGFARNNSDE